MAIDRTTLKILANYAVAAAESMAYTLMRTAYSTFVKETEDFSCQLLTREGVTFASPKEIAASWFTGLDYGPVIGMIENYEEGDICITSDPYSGFVATHSPDIHLWKPIFYNGELVCFVGCHVHNTDVGGAVPASLSRALTEVHQEGLRIPPMKIARKGVYNDDVLRIMMTNVRMPSLNWGDLNAQIAAVNTGERKILDIIKRFGFETFKQGMPELLDYAEHQARELVATIPDGEYSYADYADEDAVDGNPCRIALTVKVHGDSVTMDFTGSDPQLASALNMPTGGHERHALVMVGLNMVLTTLDPRIMLSHGTYRAARAILPEGTVMNATAPAAVGMRSLICYLTQGVVLGAFSRALPDRLPAIPALSSSMMNVKTLDGSGRLVMSSIGPVSGGAGGALGLDGDDGAGATSSFLRNTPVEINESELPIKIIRYGLSPDSGGPGKFRGGLGLRMDFQVFTPNSVVTARNRDRCIFGSPGIRGGRPGANSWFRKTSSDGAVTELMNNDVIQCEPLDIISIVGPGAGGYGNPRERALENVLRDVRCGYVSPEQAREIYGVAVNRSLEIEMEETRRLRAATPAGTSDEHFSYCANRKTFEQVWTKERYAALTAIFSRLPVSWRFFAKGQIFRMITTPPRAGEDGSNDVRLAFEVLADRFTEIRKVA